LLVDGVMDVEAAEEIIKAEERTTTGLDRCVVGEVLALALPVAVERSLKATMVVTTMDRRNDNAMTSVLLLLLLLLPLLLYLPLLPPLSIPMQGSAAWTFSRNQLTVKGP
jgi:hypothetical protein